MNKVKLLDKAYKKRFKQLNKELLSAEDAGLLVFVEHLKYLRDVYILTLRSAEAAVTINTAIEEFNAFVVEGKDDHWYNFCEIIKLHMKEWLTVNDSV
jgi:hypothetical protein